VKEAEHSGRHDTSVFERRPPYSSGTSRRLSSSNYTGAAAKGAATLTNRILAITFPLFWWKWVSVKTVQYAPIDRADRRSSGSNMDREAKAKWVSDTRRLHNWGARHGPDRGRRFSLSALLHAEEVARYLTSNRRAPDPGTAAALGDPGMRCLTSWR
jgi:hypothetical protein